MAARKSKSGSVPANTSPRVINRQSVAVSGNCGRLAARMSSCSLPVGYEEKPLRQASAFQMPP
jgi:hypothetical protein